MTETGKAPWHLWVVGIISLLWNAMGGVDYTMTHLHNAAWLANLPPGEIEWINSFPIWATSFWAIGVWGAVAGSVLLLVRSRWAVTAFGLSLLGLTGTRVFQYGTHTPADGIPAWDLALTAALGVVAVALLYYAARQRNQGILQ